jgi:hypothetical protein
MKKSPTQCTLDLLRKDCDAVQVVEHWQSFFGRKGGPKKRITGVRKDLFGIIDVLALRGEETIAVQSTSWANVSARVKKISNSENIAAVRKAGWKILVHGWRKNEQTNRYECKTVDVS